MLAAPALIRRLAPELGLTAADLLTAAGLAHLGAPEAVALAAALLAQAARRGHVCLPEAEVTARLGAIAPHLASELAVTGWPWIGGPATHPAPLARDLSRLSLWRHFRQETELASRIQTLASAAPPWDKDWLEQHLPRLFPSRGPEPDFQALAAAAVLGRGVTVVAGGPGTGKTTTLARALGLYAGHELAHGRRPRILLAAPTGKAAARMAEALRRAAAALPPAVRAVLPAEAGTVHRLLGMTAAGRPRRGPASPLAADLVAVDETSLLDGELAWHLVRAVAEGTRLVLLGDPHQLASVEEGAVLASLTASPRPEAVGPALARLARSLGGWQVPAFPEPAPPLAEGLLTLRRTYRFAAASGIQALAAALRQGDSAAVRQALTSPWSDMAVLPWRTEAELAHLLRQHALPALRLLGRGTPEAALEALDEVRVLCPLRHGPGGVAHIAALVERLLHRGPGPWFAGRPVLVLANDPDLGLANGDVGVALPGQGGGLRVWFPGPHGPRGIPPAALGRVESACALTVHKAQGSEAACVVFVLPPADHPILTRELAYTAVTRARQRLVLLGDPELLALAAARPTRRGSSLAERLWGN